ncbi:hypothetical protein [Hansschlegelia beijingensis]|uniref:Uncharacterized protein n=1 Tax=Hansschlegelia beijingensis TaxID=1133344 RepID=A0A7W6GH50_9HYPH|nr:hypothetical protein [Hansschlegelia beijingensis]MBB3974747.1 hypothetical protein [Hansschlegelia beijingensis]
MSHESGDAVLALKVLFDELCIHLASKDLLTQHEYEGLFASSVLKLEMADSPNTEGAIMFLRDAAPPSAGLRSSDPKN